MYDVIIVGAGPAGLFAAYELVENQEGLKILLIDQGKLAEKRVCPICSGEVIPKMGNKMSWHFAHKNGETCNSESMIHWWFKNELIKTRDEFTVITGNKENILFSYLINIMSDYIRKYKYNLED